MGANGRGDDLRGVVRATCTAVGTFMVFDNDGEGDLDRDRDRDRDDDGLDEVEGGIDVEVNLLFGEYRQGDFRTRDRRSIR